MLVLISSFGQGWYGSTSYKRNITNQPTSTIATAINGTSGFNGTIIWTTKDATYLYYNSSSDYTVTNSSDDIIPFETEGSGLNNSPTSVYNANAVAVYHFGTNGFAEDSTSNGNDGTIITADWTASGKFGSAYDFENTNNDLINITHSPVFNIQNFTIGTWINLESLPNEKSFIIVSKKNAWASSEGYVLRLYQNEGVYYIGTRIHTSNYDYAIQLNTSQWYYLVATYNSSNVSIYLDGIEKANFASAITIINNSAPFVIGYSPSIGTTHDFDGTIDEVRLYDVALSATEIQELYNNSLTTGAGAMTLGAEESIPPTGTTGTTITLNSPADTSTTTSINVTLNVTPTNSQTDPLDWVAFFNNATGTLLVNNTGVANNTATTYDWNDLNYSTTYYWYANASNGSIINQSSVWSFTTPTPNFWLNITSPGNDTIWNLTSLNFTFTLNSSYSYSLNWNCSLYENGTLNQTSTGLLANSTNIFTKTYPAGTEATYIYNISCTNGYVTNSTANWTILIDVVSPTMVSDLQNNNTFLLDNDLLIFQINVSDPNLYSLNISDDVAYNNDTDLQGNTTYSFNGTINVSAYSVGQHYINATVCDGHTAKFINNFVVMKTKDALTFDKTTVKSQQATIRTDYEKVSDRYKFTFEYILPRTEIKVEVPSDCVYMPDSEYKGHFVCLNDRKWIDFEGDYIVSVKGHIVTIQSKKPLTKWEFNSIGALNCVDHIYYWQKMDTTQTYNSDVSEKSSQNYYLNVTWYNWTNPKNWSARLNWNGTNYTATLEKEGVASNIKWNYFNRTLTMPNVTATTNITGYWLIYPNPNASGDYTYNITNDWNSLAYDNFTQTVYDINITECTAGTVAYNFSVMFEDTPSENLTADWQAVFNVWINDSDNYAQFNFSKSGSSWFAICVEPNWSVYHTDAYIVYETNFTHRYYLINATLDNATNNISVYNFNYSTGIETLKIYLKDTDYDARVDHYISLQRYYPAELSWRTVQMGQTDDLGVTLFHIIEDTTDYRFLFQDYTTLLETTSSTRFYCPTTDDCVVTYYVADTSTTTDSAFDYNISFSNATKLVSLVWTDTSGVTSSVRLLVKNEAGARSTTICNTTVASASGSINCNCSGYEGWITAQAFKASSPLTPFTMQWYSILGTLLSDKIGYLEAGVLAALILITIMLAGVWSPSASVMLGMGAIITLGFLGLLSWLTMGIGTLIIIMGILIIVKVRS